MQCFHTILETVNGATSSIVVAVVPFDVEKVFGRKARIDIKGTIQGHLIERTLLPLGDGRYYFMLNAKILKAINKKVGEEVYIEIEEEENTSYKEVELPDYFVVELEEHPLAKIQYERSNPSAKRWVAQFLTEPKSLEAKAKRVIKAIEVLERRYHEQEAKKQ